MSEVAVQALLAEIGGARGPRTEFLFDPELVVRRSTGPAPGALTHRSGVCARADGTRPVGPPTWATVAGRGDAVTV